MTIEKAEEIIDNIYQEKMIDLSTEIEFTELEEASVRVLREELILKKKIEELKAEIDVQNEQIIALETVLDEKEKVIATDTAMLEDSISKGQVAKNYIPKSKIEDKIKELDIAQEADIGYYQIEFAKDVLQELLEEK